MNKIIKLLLITLLCTGFFNIHVFADNENNDCTDHDNPCEIEQDSQVEISVNYTLGDKSAIKIHHPGDETNYYAGTSSSGGNLIEIHENDNNTIGIFARGNCSGFYIVSLPDNKETPENHVYYIIVNPGSSGSGNSNNNSYATFFIGEQGYLVGLANGSSDQRTLHIDGGGNHRMYIQDATMNNFIGVAAVSSDGSYTGSAPQDIITGVISDLTVTSDNTDLVTVGQKSTYHFDDKTVTGGVDTVMIPYTIKANKTGTANLTIAFKYGGTDYSANYSVNVIQEIDLVVDVESDLDSVTGSTVIEKLNNIFASDEAYIAFVKTINGNADVDSNTKVTFAFDKTKTYNGIIEFNCPIGEVTLISNGVSDPEFYSSDGSELYSYDETVQKATIVGGIKTKGGLNEIKNINFVASDSYLINNQKIGLYVSNTDAEVNQYQGDTRSDVYTILGCSFKDYTVGATCYENGLVSGFECCLFKNNTTAILLDSKKNNHYSDSMFNTFVDNGTAIKLSRRSRNASALHFVYNRNYFFGTGTDYYVTNNTLNSGIMFFDYCFYGDIYSNGFIDTNVRGSRVVYEDGTPGVITTGPCIRYPQNTVNKFGFDIGTTTGSNKLHNNKDLNIHVSDLYNSSVDIDIYDDDSNKDLGTLTFTGGNH